jgi:dipeptidyl aminopeptidase/acylaminoacyl peptidase
MDVLAALLSALVLLTPGGRSVAERPFPVATGGGLVLAGTLTVPRGPGPYPAAVLVGGFGPENRDGSFGRAGDGGYRALAIGLARRGVAVLRYDKRGIGGSGGPTLSWLDARPLAIDAAAEARALAALPGVDPRRLALVGHSQGGDLALQAARVAPVTRVVTISAPGRPLGRLPFISSGAAGRILDRLAGPGVSRATLARDPRRDAVRVRQPVLLVHGTRDRTVPISDMARLAGARRAAGLPTRTLRLPGSGHLFEAGDPTPAAMVDAVAAFIR